MSDQSLQLGEDKLPDVLEALWPARAKWYNIGLRFRIEPSDLDTIDLEADVDTKFRKMLGTWLRSGKNCTWIAVYEALNHPTVNMLKVAKEHSDFLKKMCETAKAELQPVMQQVQSHSPSEDSVAKPMPPTEYPLHRVGETVILSVYHGPSTVLEVVIRVKPNVNVATNESGDTDLTYFCQKEDTSGVRFLNFGAGPNTCTKVGQTSLLIAVRKGNVVLARELLEAGANPNHMEESGLSALMLCCESGNSEMAELLLLKSQADPDLQQSDGCTALMLAAQNGHKNVVMALLNFGASVDMQKEDEWTALMLAAQNGHQNVVEVLLQYGASVDRQTEDGWTAMMSAVQNGHKNVVDTLLQHGANVDLTMKDEWTALMLAAQNGHQNVVEVLLQYGASVDRQTEDGWTAMMSAVQNGHENVVDTLLQHGANVDLTMKDGVSALMIAIYHGSSSVLKVLFRAKPDVNVATYGNGDTALTLACQNEDISSTRYLLKLEANPNTCTKEGQTPLLVAVRKGNVVLARELLEAGANPNHMEEGGPSALMLCCESGNCEMAELLLKSLADPDLQQSDTGFTALMFACKGGHLNTVFTLLENNANTRICNKAGMTAADVASINLHSDVYSVLQLITPQDTVTTEELEHPDYELMEEVYSEVVKRFHAQMDHTEPIIALVNKGIALEVPTGKVIQYIEKDKND